jgi:hypothetical protein
MLTHSSLKAFLPTVMPVEAKKFYKDILELKLLSEDNYALQFDANGTFLRITIVPQFKPHSFTVLGWDVNDIHSAIQLLNEKGVYCEKYDFLEQDSFGVWTSPSGTKVAWFKDPDGNLLSLSE